jgi:hypothetical protein
MLAARLLSIDYFSLVIETTNNRDLQILKTIPFNLVDIKVYA